MKKTKKIDFSEETLLATADGLFEEGNYIEVLRILNKNAVLNGNDEDSYFMYAEAYDELGLYDRAIHNLFKSLDYDAEDPAECYKGLAVCFMNVGNRDLCAYYYARYSDCVTPYEDDDMEDVRSFINGDEERPGPLRLVWPPELADFSSEFDQGVMDAVSGNTDKAMEAFESVPKGNSLYLHARMNVATCCLMKGDYDAAEKECMAFMEENPENPPLLAVITLANVRIEKKQWDEARDLARKLMSYETDSREEMYKIATIYCAVGMHKEGYECFTRMVEELETYSLNVLFFRAVAAFNAKMGKEAVDAIGMAFDVYPTSVCLLYSKTLMQNAVDKGSYFQMEYAFGLPENISSEYMSLLFAFASMSKTLAKQTYKNTELLNAVLLCFDGEYMEDKRDVQRIAIKLAVKVGEYDIVRDLLLERRLANEVKLDALIALAGRNVDEEYGVVVSNLLSRVQYRKMNIGRKCRSVFLQAYGMLVGRFSFVDQDLGIRFAAVFEQLYFKMEFFHLLEPDLEAGTLAVAAYVLSNENLEHIKLEDLVVILKADRMEVEVLCNLIKPL